MNMVRPLLLLALPALFTGCFDIQQHYTLNSDGSGKVLHEARFQTISIQFNGTTPDPEESMRQSVSEMLEKSKGVDAWKDVTYELDETGLIHFKGIAYFKDLSKLKIQTGSAEFKGFAPRLSQTTPGHYSLQIENENEDSGNASPRKAKSPDFSSMSKEEREKYLKIERAKYQQMKPMLSSFISNFNWEMTFELPGSIESLSNFSKTAEGNPTIKIEGAKFLAIIDQLIMDEAWLTQMLKSGATLQDGFPKMDEVLNEKLFGQKGPVEVRFTESGKSLFDFKSELASAQKTMPTLMKTLSQNRKNTAAPQPMQGGIQFSNLRVGGVRIVKESENEIMPFNQPKGFSLSLIGELPSPVLQIKEGQVETAIIDNGTSILKPKEWDRRISFPRLVQNNTAVLFEVPLEVPPPGTKSLTRIAGSLTYYISKSSKEVDLGIQDFKPGASGSQFNASIESLQPSQWNQGQTDITLKVALDVNALKEARFFDQAGKLIETSRNGYSSMGESNLTINFSTKGSFPKKGKIIFVIYDGMESYQLPFELKNLDLFGNPLP